MFLEFLKVVVDASYVANSLNDVNAIMAASAPRKITLQTTNLYVM